MKKKFHFKKDIRFTLEMLFEFYLQLRISFRISKYFELRKCFFSSFFSTYQTYLRLVKLKHYNNAVCLFALLMRWVCILIVWNSLFEST